MWQTLVSVASDPAVGGLLLALGFFGLLAELQTLQGVAGIVGVGAFALFFGSHVAAGLANPALVLLALAGLAGILAELHLLPGSGVPGSLGVIALVAAIVLSFGPGSIAGAVQALAIAIVLTVLGALVLVRIHPESAFLARLGFAGRQGPEYVAGPLGADLIGHEGFAISFLRPAGIAAIAGTRVDVLTEGAFVAAGTPVVVTRVEGARVFVKPTS